MADGEGGAERVLCLPRDGWERLARFARERYPEEACGVLLSGPDPGDRDGPGARVRVEEVVECANAASERRRRYEIAPRDLFALHKRCRGEGLEIVGYWHSHPTGSAVPSEEDRIHAFPGVSFLVVPVEGSHGPPRAGLPRSWRLDAHRRRFGEERVEIGSSDVETPGRT